MRSAILLIALAAAISASPAVEQAGAKEKAPVDTRYVENYTKSEYKEHARCDATDAKCYVADSYGPSYNADTYTYKRQYGYPGPRKRFHNWFSAILLKIKIGFHTKWHHFKKHWNHWCDVLKSDKQRFEDWKACKADKWKKWWAYHQDLCRTKKELWDDAMREFHRQWTHYKHHAKEEYNRKKTECNVKEVDYDDTPEYPKKLNEYGVTPIEDHYKQYSSKKEVGYSRETYKKSCDKKAVYERPTQYTAPTTGLDQKAYTPGAAAANPITPVSG